MGHKGAVALVVTAEQDQIETAEVGCTADLDPPRMTNVLMGPMPRSC